MVKYGISILCGLFCLLSFSFTGCAQVSNQDSVNLGDTSSPIGLSSTRVPNVDIDLYLLAQQENPTAIPASVFKTPDHIMIKSLAIWGTVVGDELVLGAGVKMVSVEDARVLNERITMGADSWKMLSGDVLYLVYGSATAREPLKRAILNQDSKYFDDTELLRAASSLPNNTTDRPIAIGVIKPSIEFVNSLVKGASHEQTEQVTNMIKLVDPRAIAVGAYSPKALDVERVLAVLQGRMAVSELNIYTLGLIESGRPGLLVESTAKTLLTRYGFEEVSFGAHTLYRMMIKTNQQQTIPLLVWLNGNRVFASTAIQEAHAQQVISAAIAANLQD
jgi:hypothetical protein